MTPPPPAVLLAMAALVAVGSFALGAWVTQRAWPRTLNYLLRTEIRLGRAEHRVRTLDAEVARAREAVSELTEAIPKTWVQGYHAGQHVAEFRLVVDEVEDLQRQPARWN